MQARVRGATTSRKGREHGHVPPPQTGGERAPEVAASRVAAVSSEGLSRLQPCAEAAGDARLHGSVAGAAESSMCACLHDSSSVVGGGAEGCSSISSADEGEGALACVLCVESPAESSDGDDNDCSSSDDGGRELSADAAISVSEPGLCMHVPASCSGGACEASSACTVLCRATQLAPDVGGGTGGGGDGEEGCADGGGGSKPSVDVDAGTASSGTASEGLAWVGRLSCSSEGAPSWFGSSGCGARQQGACV